MGQRVPSSERASADDLARTVQALREEITERHRVERALRESEEKYRTLFETTNTGYVIVDPEGRVVDANAEYVRLTGRQTIEEIRGRPVLEWTAPHDLERNAREVEKCAQTGVVRSLEIDYVDSRGAITPIEINATVIQTPEGTRILSLCRDITSRKRAERALRETERQSRTLVESVQAIVWRCTMGSLAFSYVSPEAETLLGFPVEQWTGDPSFWLDHMHPDDREWVPRYCMRSSEEGRDHSFEYRMIAADGRVVWLRDIVRVVMDGGHPCELLGVMIDVTDRRRAEDEIRLLNQTLEQRVRERTADLQAAVEELEAFSYSVSHDLRAPLRAIDGFCQMLGEGPCLASDPESRALLERVRKNARKMAELIDGLIALSRLARDGMHVEEIDLSALAAAILQELALGDPGRDVETFVAPGLRTRGDSRLVRTLLENLLGNAWKFTAAKPRAKIDFGSEPTPDGDRVYVVRDDGAGFDMSHADKLFQPFERLHGQSEFPGNGIGLATARRIVQRHGGSLWGEGEIGRGATFRFSLGDPA